MAELVASWRRPPNPENDYKEVFNKQTKRCNDFLSEGSISSVDQKARRTADASSTPGCGGGPFSQGPFLVQTALWRSYSPVNGGTH